MTTEKHGDMDIASDAMETSSELQANVKVNGDHGEVTPPDRAQTPTAGLSTNERKVKQKPEDILKNNNKSNPSGTMNGAKSTGEDIENCTPPHSPAVANKALDGLRKEPRAKMTLSPNKAAAEASAASMVTVKHGTARKTLNSASSLTLDLSKPPNNKVAELVAASEAKSSAASSDSEPGETTSCMSSSDETSQSPVWYPTWVDGRRARKCLPGRRHTTSQPAAKGVVAAPKQKQNSIANMTLQLCEIEKTLGIKTLNDIDAKTLDKLILEKARPPRRESKSRTASPNVSRTASPSIEESSVTNMVSILKNNNVLTPKQDKAVLSPGPSVEETPDVENHPKPEVKLEPEVEAEPPTATSRKYTPQKKRRRKRTGNYDLPSVKNRKKKAAPAPGGKGLPPSSEGAKKEVKPAKPRPKPVIAVAGKAALDDSYETVEELDLTQSPVTSNQVPNVEVPATGPSTPVLQTRRRNSRGVMGAKTNGSNSPVPLPPKTQSQSKPVLGLKKTPVAAAPSSVTKPGEEAGTPPAGATLKTKQKKTNKLKTDEQSGSELDSPGQVIINPKTKKPYVRGPYRSRVKVKSEDDASGESQAHDTSSVTTPEPAAPEKGIRESSSASKTIPILEKFTKKLSNPQSMVSSSPPSAEGDTTSPSPQAAQGRKRPKGWAAAALAKSKAKKRRLIQPGTNTRGNAHNKGLKVSMTALFKKKLKASPAKAKLATSKLGASKLATKPTNKTASEPTKTSPKDAIPKSAAANAGSAATNKVPKNQRSVLDMFSELKRRRSSLQLQETKPQPDEGKGKEAPKAPTPEPTVNTAATQVEDEEPLDPLIPLEDPAIMDLPRGTKGSRPTTLAELKATLDAEAEEQQPLRKKRKRKGTNDGSGSTRNSLAESDPAAAWTAKRLKPSDPEEEDSLGVALLCSPAPQPPVRRRIVDSTSNSSNLSASKNDLAASTTMSGSSGSLAKFVNTPNGIQYPVTPPKTPECSVGAGQDRATPQLVSPLAKERDFLPLCCCRINGAAFNTEHTTLYCQALDSIDGRVAGCCNKVTNTQLVRPAVKIPFMAICEVHRKRLKLHQCCPGCGHFCTQGTFFQCKKDSCTAVHHFHRQCQVYKDAKYYCPHCGEESSQYEVALKLYEPRNTSFFAKPPVRHNAAHTPHARMGSSTRPVKAVDTQSEGSNEEVLAKLPSGKEIKTGGLKFGPSRTELVNALGLLKGEKPKKLRTGPKSLYYGARSGDIERVVFMLVEGCDPNFKNEEHDNQTSVHGAAFSGNQALLHLLVQAGGDINMTDTELRTPLMIASEQGHLELAAYLLRTGAVYDARGEDGMTALHLAAKAGYVELCKHILANTNLSINVTDDGGWTSLIWAAEHKNHECVKFLLAGGGDPNIKDNEENIALHWAVYAGSIDIAEMFLDAGCDIECPNEHGDRALHIAARQGHYECIVLLLARGADSDARNNDNETPMDCCTDEDGLVHMALKVNRQLKSFAAKRHQRPVKLLHRDISKGRESNPLPVVNDIDDENYPQDFHYVTENVETSPMMVNRVITSLQSCQCKDDCSSVFCMCGRNSVRCWYTKEGRLVSDFNKLEPPLIFECNKACSCWSTCQNRVVQLGITSRLEVFRTNGRGWGVRASLDIKQGTFICEYIGEHISDAEADSREDDSYLFDLDNKDTDTFCIDARRYANVARFINHLCEPNLIPVKVFVEHQDLRFPRICFFASRDIKAGEELGFDYGERFWIIKWKQFTCACKSPKCKYSSEMIHKTIEDYNRRQMEEEAVDEGV